MTLALMKTKAEQAIGEHFDRVVPTLPGAGWVQDLRRQAIGAFAATGLPHRRIEAFKYTDLRDRVREFYPPVLADEISRGTAAINRALGPELAALDCIRLVFVNGKYCGPKPSSVRGLHFDTLASVLGASGFDWMKPHFAAGRDALWALNTAFVTDGAVFRLEDGVALAKPIHLVFITDSAAPSSIAVRNLIEIGKDAEATILESYVGIGDAPSQANAVTEIRVLEGARVHHAKVFAEGPRSMHFSTWNAEIGAKATYRAFQLTRGAGLARNQLFVTFAGEGAKIDLSGLFLASGREHIDTTLVVDHAVPGCESRELFRGVLADYARGVFQGKIIVRPDAQKTDGKQMAQALMLSPDAEFDSKPELEIFADDVVCGHGSTVAEIDPDLVFYCRSRGIPEAEARALLVRSFILETLEQMENEPIREVLTGLAEAWLDQRTAERPLQS